MNHRTKNRRFLLKVTALGAGALVAACSSTSESPTTHGLVAIPVDGGADGAVACGGGPCGVVALPPDGGDDGSVACGGGGCGSIALPPDGGDGGDGSVNPCEDASCGLVANPPDGGDASDQ